MTVYIEGMENELEHFPQLIDDNGFDTYPKFVTWYAPGRVTNMGSAIPKAKVCTALPSLPPSLPPSLLFGTWYAPGRVTNMGSAISKAKVRYALLPSLPPFLPSSIDAKPRFVFLFVEENVRVCVHPSLPSLTHTPIHRASLVLLSSRTSRPATSLTPTSSAASSAALSPRASPTLPSRFASILT